METPRFPIIKCEIKDRVAIVLAGGKGTRMGGERNKVCHLVDGVPFINKTITTLKHCGFPVIVVVGYRYEDVITTVGREFSDVSFILQEEQLGTAHAVRCACRYLRSIGFAGDVLIIAGDKLVLGNALARMREKYEEGDADLLFATKIGEGKSFGRVMRDEEGRVKRIQETKGKEGEFPPIGETNQSIYMIKAGLLYEALEEVKPNEEDGEERLTDIVEVLYSKGAKIDTFPLGEEEVLTFNTPEELERVRVKMEERRVKGRKHLKRVEEWMKLFQGGDERLDGVLRHIYADDENLLEEKRKVYLEILEKFAEEFGPSSSIFFVRAPGRLNLMGRHIDHRGGAVNVIAMDKEIIMAVEPREDDQVKAVNLKEEFPPRHFSIQEEMGKLRWASWSRAIESEELKEELSRMKGDWINYIKAGVLKMQDQHRDIKFKGFNAVVYGDIPIGSGLSSSSALVVASAKSILRVNGIASPPRDFILCCGEGEWYVGTRGGHGDHAAMEFGVKGNVSQIRFFPLELVGRAPLPKGYRILFCYSQEPAKKGETVKDAFNQKIACYEIGMMMLKQNFPQYADKIQHLRDVNPSNLGVPEWEIYRMLLSLPERMSREEILAYFPPQRREELERILANHSLPPFDGYPIRGVCLFGIAECARSAKCLQLIQEGDMRTLGHLMNISHHGDRVTILNKKGERVPYRANVSTQYLERLMENCRRHPDKEAFRLMYQPGEYGCSTYKIDMLVDIASKVPGVLGAQVAGAGLGGCVIALVEEDKVDALKEAWMRDYYIPLSLEPLIEAPVAVQGAGYLEVE